jgi:hypothetical protein
MVLTLLILGLAAWIGTSTIVEAEVFRDVREACDKLHDKHNKWWSFKLRYLVHCHMCTGIWVSAILALFVPPLVASGFVGWGITALAIKGVAHSFLVLQKLGEAWTDKAKSEAEYQNWMTAQEQEFVGSVLHIPGEEDYDLEDVLSGRAPEVVNHVTGIGWPNDYDERCAESR